MKDYRVDVTDLLAAFRVIAQPGVPPEEAGAAIAAESSTGTWTTAWTEWVTSLDRYKGRCYDLELISGEDTQYIAYIAYPLDLFEEGSVTNILTSIVGNVFGFKALKCLRLEDLRIPTALLKTFQGVPYGIQVSTRSMAAFAIPCGIRCGIMRPMYSLRVLEVMPSIRDSQLVIDRTTLYWGLLTLLVLAVLFSSYLVG